MIVLLFAMRQQHAIEVGVALGGFALYFLLFAGFALLLGFVVGPHTMLLRNSFLAFGLRRFAVGPSALGHGDLPLVARQKSQPRDQ